MLSETSLGVVGLVSDLFRSSLSPFGIRSKPLRAFEALREAIELGGMAASTPYVL